MLILGSCLALNLGYSGCCVWSLSPFCNNNGCYCDQHCHMWNDCCSDIADIGCYPAFSSSPMVTPTATDLLGKIECFWIACNLKLTYVYFYIKSQGSHILV